STIELPKGMPGEVLQHFTRTRILNKPMNMQLLGDAQPHTGGERRGGGRGFGGERRDVGDMQLYRIEVGRDDGVEVRHIVGAIANEGDISSRYIGNIKLFA
ncbi:DbpA RNA binding domain-containing protein, partial [Pseudomonas aeruginosa]|uniref:DbpA RNA binding domain-containing protein n=1 Tax=Pseudomonas aeruginosa TaxID=287 RepID=UPI0031B6A8A1